MKRKDGDETTKGLSKDNGNAAKNACQEALYGKTFLRISK